jgi:hypothetical protein
MNARLPSNLQMDIYDLRRSRLRSLIDSACQGNQAQLSSRTGIKAPQINRWLSLTTNEPRRITEESARMIERKMQLTPGWLDRPEDYEPLAARQPTATAAYFTPNGARVAQVVKIMQTLSDADQERVVGAAMLIKAEADELLRHTPKRAG